MGVRNENMLDVTTLNYADGPYSTTTTSGTPYTYANGTTVYYYDDDLTYGIDLNKIGKGSFKKMAERAAQKLGESQMSTALQNIFYSDERPFMAVGNDGNYREFESQEAAESWAESQVQKNDGTEYVVCKAVTRVHVDKPVVRKEIK